MYTYRSVEKTALKFYDVLRRRVYITPKSYLDSISMYKLCLDQNRHEVNSTIIRLSNGLHKLAATNTQVADLKTMLTKLRPELENQSKMASEKANMVKIEKKKAEEKERIVEKEANEVSVQAADVKSIKDEVELELEIARPAMEEAKAALEVLNDDDLNEVKSFKTPPDAVVMTLQAVLTYFKEPKTDWPAAKKVMGDKNFKEKLKNFEVEKLTNKTLDKVRKIIRRKEFDPDDIINKAKAAACLAKWCIASEKYAVIRQNMKPLEERLEKTTQIYDEANSKLMKKQSELKQAQDQVKQLEEDLKNTLDRIIELNENIKINEEKLERAGKLISLTKEEGENWKETVKQLKEDMVKLIGDTFLGTCSISYIGPFTGVYRDMIVNQWIKKLKENKIPFSENYKLRNILGDAVKIKSWNLSGLPSDSVSIDNGIMCDRSQRWPLLIDPQTQANQWIRKTYGEELKIVKLTDTDTYAKTVDTALRLGQVVLIEDVQEEIDPALDNILQKAIFDNNGLPTIHFGGKDITYDDHFKLFITTKLPNPHYLPEVCIKLTIINFTVTFEGLEEQMLVDVVIHEDPQVERERDELTLNLAKLESDKRDVEIKILKTLAESNEETILDGDDLIIILETSKEKAASIKSKLVEAIEIEAKIVETRNQFKRVSIRGSILYFVITDLAIIDPMYQYSLSYVKKLFNDAIKESEKSDELEKRIQILIDSITKTIYNNI